MDHVLFKAYLFHYEGLCASSDEEKNDHLKKLEKTTFIYGRDYKFWYFFQPAIYNLSQNSTSEG